MIVGIDVKCGADLFDITEAIDAARLFLRHRQGRQEHSGQNGNYGDDNQEFD